MLSLFSKIWFYLKNAWHIKDKAATRKILCIDEDADFCLLVENLALSLGIQIEKAYSMEIAKQKINQDSSYAAFIIDGELPDAPGLELAAWIREKKSLSIPIIFLSRVYHDAATFRILKEHLQVDYVLEKPIQKDTLAQLLCQIYQFDQEMVENRFFPKDFLVEAKRNYQKTIVDKIERLERMIRMVQKNPDHKNILSLRKEIHRLAGSSGSYGYPQVSQLCKKLEQDLMNRMEPSSLNQSDNLFSLKLNDFFREIKLHFQIDQEELSEQFFSPPLSLFPGFYVVDDNPQLKEHLTGLLKDKGECIVEKSLENFFEVVSASNFDARIVLINEKILEFQESGQNFLNTPTLFTLTGILFDSNRRDHLFDLFKRGFSYLFFLPFNEKMIDFIQSESLYHREKYKVLIVDDDPDSGNYVLQSLKYFGCEIRVLNDVLLLQSTLMDYRPDLLLAEVDLSDEKKVDIFLLLQRLQYKKLTVAMVTTPQECNLIQTLYGSEVDDIIFKPLESSILQKRFLQLFRRANEEKNTDPSTGLHTVEVFLEIIQSRKKESQENIFDTLVFLQSNESSLSVKSTQRISHFIKNRLLLEKEACYAGEGRFIIFFEGYDLEYLQLIMQNFIGEIHDLENSVRFSFELMSLKESLLNQIKEEFPVKVTPRQLAKEKKCPYACIFTSHNVANFIKFFRNEGMSIQENPEIEGIISRVSSGKGTLLIFIDLPNSVIHEIKNKLTAKKIKIPVIYFPYLNPETLSLFLKEELRYTENPFNLILIISHIDKII